MKATRPARRLVACTKVMRQLLCNCMLIASGPALNACGGGGGGPARGI